MRSCKRRLHSSWLIVGMQQMSAMITVVISSRKRKLQWPRPRITEAEIQGGEESMMEKTQTAADVARRGQFLASPCGRELGLRPKTRIPSVAPEKIAAVEAPACAPWEPQVPLPSVERPLISPSRCPVSVGTCCWPSPAWKHCRATDHSCPHLATPWMGHCPADAPPGPASALPVGTAWTIFLDCSDPT